MVAPLHVSSIGMHAGGSQVPSRLHSAALAQAVPLF
jgi:hypothetical protein